MSSESGPGEPTADLEEVDNEIVERVHTRADVLRRSGGLQYIHL